MSGATNRLRSRVARDFRATGAAGEVVRLLEAAGLTERIQAAIVFAARGDVREIERAVRLAAIDWRDVLVNGGLADGNWAAVLDRELGS